MVAVFCQTFSIFAVFDGGDLLPGSSAIIVLPLMLGVVFVKVRGLLCRGCFWSEACFAEVFLASLPDFV